MRLSELKTGERGVIVKVMGHGGFRKRIVEMGFIKGKTVEVLLNAPLQDPVKYKILGYEISLRREEAQLIEVVSQEEARRLEKADVLCDKQDGAISEADTDDDCMTDQQMISAAMKKRKVINVALVGNPNCGKTSLFNFISGAHERVGNYSGVTVDAKEGHTTFGGYTFNLVDLPGTYSLSAYSPEEMYVRRQIIDKTPDVVINVLDASNLERNLYLTTQLVDMHLRMVCALNMFDEFKKRGDKLNCHTLGMLFGVPMIPTVFKTGEGVDELFNTIIKIYDGVGATGSDTSDDIDSVKYTDDASNGNQKGQLDNEISQNLDVIRHIHLNHGTYIENAITMVKRELHDDEQIRHKYSTRYLAIKLLERDADAEKVVKALPNSDDIMRMRDNAAAMIEAETKEDSETAIMDAKYGLIHGALKEAGFSEGKKEDTYMVTHLLDMIITNKYFGFPIFFLILYIMFQTTFSLGQYPMDWIQAGVDALGNMFNSTLPDGPIKALLVDGIIGGVGAVIVFVPQILILYFFISFMEDSGYMARAAFIMDKVMHKMGLHGKSFIPLIMGFGCNVPAIMSTRTIESRHSRLITMLILPMMSCSARLPIYIMVTGVFFSLRYQSLVMISLYVVGIIMAVVLSRVFSKFVVKGDDTPFVMELPPYRFPTGKAITRHTWEKGKEYLKKMGGVILVASIIVWALGYFPHDDKLSAQAQQEQSYIGRIGKVIEPVFRPQGFDWKLDVGLVSGIGAKEIVASTMGVLYSDGSNASSRNDTEKYTHMRQQMIDDGLTPLAAYCYLLFVLLYFPCIATITAIKNESGSWKWALFSAAYTTVVAWIVSAMVYQVGRLFI